MDRTACCGASNFQEDSACVIACPRSSLACALAAPAAAQATGPDGNGKNLKFFPQDITREALIQRMREFSFALNVRCQHCHAGGDGVSFDGVDFSSDDKPAKLKARAMLRMTDEINKTLLPKMPSRAEPRVEVNCATCHRGRRMPKSLQTTLFEIVETEGAAAAVAKYKELRADMTAGASTTSASGRSRSWRGAWSRRRTPRRRSPSSR